MATEQSFSEKRINYLATWLIGLLIIPLITYIVASISYSIDTGGGDAGPLTSLIFYGPINWLIFTICLLIVAIFIRLTKKILSRLSLALILSILMGVSEYVFLLIFWSDIKPPVPTSIYTIFVIGGLVSGLAAGLLARKS